MLRNIACILVALLCMGCSNNSDGGQPVTEIQTEPAPVARLTGAKICRTGRAALYEQLREHEGADGHGEQVSKIAWTDPSNPEECERTLGEVAAWLYSPDRKPPVADPSQTELTDWERDFVRHKPVFTD